MLSTLIDTLHEDLNKITNKPYVEYKDTDGRSEADIASEYWQGYLKRESSIFFDIFNGQFRSRVQCTRCGHISLSFDTFNILQLPIPNQKNQNFTVKYIPIDMSEAQLEFTINAGEYVTMNEIRQKIDEYLEPKDQDDEDWIAPFLSIVQT
jgi:hypothetical protein